MMKHTPLALLLALLGTQAGRAVEALPDLVPIADASKSYVYGWTLDRNQIPGRTLMRLSTAVGNKGKGPLEIWGGAVSGAAQQVYQRVYDTNGTSRDRLAGSFIYHPSHSHVHFEGFAVYNLRRIEAGGGVGAIIAAGQKTSFCLINITQYFPSFTTAALRVNGRGGSSCGTIQGISTGYADVYHSGLTDQWIDVTDVPSGTYWLEVIADPDNNLQELDETNNLVRIQVTYTNPVPPPVNREPVVTNPGAQTTERGQAVNLRVTGTDPDGDALSWTAIGLPQGLTMTPGSGVITGTIAASAQSSYSTTVSASDGRLVSSTTFTWTTTAPPPPPPVNHVPQIFSPGPQTGTVPNTAYLAINATDEDGNTLTYGATGLPPGLGINSTTGIISGTFTTAGSYSTIIGVTDGSLTASTTFVWNVNPVQTGTGFYAEYFSTRDFAPRVLTRTDPGINFNWGTGSPGAGVPPDEFSARWYAELLPAYNEEYTFTVSADNGAKVWVNGNLLVYEWEQNGVPASGTWSGRNVLQAGVRVPIRVEYFDATGNASISVKWRSASQPEQIIPAARLFPATPPPATDTTYPTATLDGPQYAAAAFQVQITFSEPVFGLDVTDFAITNGTVTSLTGSSASYAIGISPSGAGNITVRIPAAAVSDLSGNAGIASAPLTVQWVPAGPVATDAWSLDEPAGITAANSVRNIPGVYLDGPVQGLAGAGTATGKAARFDGVDDCVRIPALNYTAASASYVIWVKREGVQNPWAQFIYSRSAQTDAGFGVGDNHELRYHWEGDNWDWSPSPALNVPDNQWVLAALVVRPDAATLYLRTAAGLQKAVHSGPHGVQPFEGFTTLGRDGTRDSRGFKGMLDEARFFQTALTDADIDQLYQSAGGGAVNRAPVVTSPGPLSTSRGGNVSYQFQGADPEGARLTWTVTGLPAGLSMDSTGYVSGVINSTAATANTVTATASDGVLTNGFTFGWAVSDAGGGSAPAADDFWTLNDLSGGVAANAIRAYNGTHLGTVRQGEPGATPATSRSAYYNGVSDTTRLPALNYNTSAMTAVMWVRRNGAQSPWSQFWFSRTAQTDAGLGIGYDNELRYHWEGDQYDFSPSPAIIVPDNQWCLAALVISPTGGTMHLRTASGLRTAVNAVPHGIQPFEGYTFLGSDQGHGDRYFKGWLDEVRFYRRALTAAEIELIYQNATGVTRPIGVTGTYFNGPNFDSQVVQRIDQAINFNWGTGSPAQGVTADNFSVRWTGCLVPQFTQTYTFHVLADQGCRLWIGNQQIINAWQGSGTGEVTGTANLTAGTPAPFRLEFFDLTSTARCELYWSGPSLAKQIIPQSRLLINETSMPPGSTIYIDPNEDAASNTVPASVTAAITDLSRAQTSFSLEPSPDGMLTLNFSRIAGAPEVYSLEVSQNATDWTIVPDEHWSIRGRSDGLEDVRIAHACCLISPRLGKSFFRLRVHPSTR